MSGAKVKHCPFCGGMAMTGRRGDAFCLDENCAGWTVNRCSVEKWNRRADLSDAAIAEARRAALMEAADALWNGPIREYGRSAQGQELNAAHKCRDVILALIPGGQP